MNEAVDYFKDKLRYSPKTEDVHEKAIGLKELFASSYETFTASSKKFCLHICMYIGNYLQKVKNKSPFAGHFLFSVF